MQPFIFTNNGIVIVTSVYLPHGRLPPSMAIYRRRHIHQSPARSARGGGRHIAQRLTLNANDNVIISEVYYNFTPMFVRQND